jgi:hypothetical protein
MRRVLVVVATFVALNTGGFLTYRALQPESAVASTPAANGETFSRPAVTIQPKPSKTSSEIVPDPAVQDSQNSIVSEPTLAPEEEPEAAPDDEKEVKRAPTRRVHRAPAAPVQKVKAPENRPPEQSNSGIRNPVLEMDDNPYKRGE